MLFLLIVLRIICFGLTWLGSAWWFFWSFLGSFMRLQLSGDLTGLFGLRWPLSHVWWLVLTFGWVFSWSYSLKEGILGFFIWRGQKSGLQVWFPLHFWGSFPDLRQFLHTHAMVNIWILKGDPLHLTALWTLVALIFPNTSQIRETVGLCLSSSCYSLDLAFRG